ncbi:MAG: Nif3-like dinuclear metal center hexameric protein [Kiritimatiellia bacterium]
MTTYELAEFLNRTLRIENFRDVSNNGLQLANDGTLSKVICGVDANLKLLEIAKEKGAECIVCHHGISWGDSLRYITGLNYRILSLALKNNIAIYACHLPLDAHDEFGNNAQICKTLGLIEKDAAFDYHGELIGFTAELPQPVSFNEFCDKIKTNITDTFQTLHFGTENIQKVGIVSGGAADMTDQAHDLGVDLFLTGETTLQAYNLAEQLHQNVVFAGHYATEIFGVRALSELINSELGIPAECMNFHIPF